jgi:hypothetical protein
MGPVPGFEYHGVDDKNRAVVTVAGKVYADPVFDCPVMDPADGVVTVLDHASLCRLAPWCHLIPRRLRDAARNRLCSLFDVYFFFKGAVPLRRPPPSFVPIWKDSSPPFSNVAAMGHYDGAKCLTEEEMMRFVGSDKWFYKEKFDGVPLLLVLCHSGVFIFLPETQRWYVQELMEKRYLATPGYAFWYQYELVNGTAHLCALNACLRDGEILPMGFETRQRMYSSQWFEECWKPLSSLELPLPESYEGLILCASRCAHTRFKHFESGEWITVGGSCHVKRRVTVDALDSMGICCEYDYKTGALVRIRPGKRPNTPGEISLLNKSVPLEMLYSFKIVNGVLVKAKQKDITVWDGGTVSRYMDIWTGKEIAPPERDVSHMFSFCLGDHCMTEEVTFELEA